MLDTRQANPYVEIAAASGDITAHARFRTERADCTVHSPRTGGGSVAWDPHPAQSANGTRRLSRAERRRGVEWSGTPDAVSSGVPRSSPIRR
jgi:hypothetical protein